MLENWSSHTGELPGELIYDNLENIDITIKYYAIVAQYIRVVLNALLL